jgi:hypothetical protein
MSKLEVDTIAPQSGTQITIGESGDTVTIPTGVTLDASNATTTLPANVVTTDGTQTLTNKSIAATQLTGTITPSDGTVTNAKIVDSTIELAKLSATGTKDATTFLRGDNTFAVPSGGDWVKIASSDATSVSSIEFQDIFTTDYRHYRVIGADINPNNDQLVFQFLTSGSTAITTAYYSGGTEVMINSSTSASSVIRRWNGDDINLVDQNTGTDLTRIAWFDMTLVNPTDSASYRSGTFLSGVYSNNGQIYNYHKSFLNTNTGSSYGGIKFQGNGSQTINHAKITIYGVK